MRDLGEGFYRVVAHCGFMETPNVPRILARSVERGAPFDHLEGELLPRPRDDSSPPAATRFAFWRKRLFIYLSRNARPGGLVLPDPVESRG